jgi:hypothetical protein
VISTVYELPIGRGHRLLGHDNRWVELLVGGFQLNLQETIQSGTPVGLNGGYNLIADPRVGVSKSKLTYFNTCTLLSNGNYQTTNAAHSGVITGPAGSVCSNPAWQQLNSANLDLRQTGFQSGTIRSPNAPLGNLSASKRFKFTESVNAQFRFEAFNFTNTYIPNSPDTNPGNGTFGTISTSSANLSAPNSQANIPRIVQLGFKLNF